MTNHKLNPINSFKELKIACYLYNKITSYDDQYKTLKDVLDIEPVNENSIDRILVWLRGWGCRQFKKSDTNLSIKSIFGWYNKNKAILAGIPDDLINYSQPEGVIVSLFDELADLSISNRKNTKVRVGPVGAAKILFALKPSFFTPWDAPIIDYFCLHLNGVGYHRHLLNTKDQIVHVSSFVDNINDLPSLIDRNISTLPKIIDEYNWITITKGIIPAELIKIIGGY